VVLSGARSPRAWEGDDPHDARPRYVRIAEVVQRHIRVGAYESGALLPGEAEMGRAFGVSRGTMRQAIGLLQERGFVQPEVGRGTRVLGSHPRNTVFELADVNDEIRRRGQTPSTRLLTRATEPATAEVAARLRVAARSPTIRLVRVRLADGVPLVYETRLLAVETCPELLAEDVESQSVHRLLRERYHIPLVRVELAITRAPLLDEVAECLTMAFYLDRVTYQAETVPVTLFQAFYRSDHVDLAVHH